MDTRSIQPDTSWWSERWLEPESLRTSWFGSEPAAIPKDLGTIGGLERDLGRGLNVFTFSASFNYAASCEYTSGEPYLWFSVSLAGNSTNNSGKVTGEVSPGAAYCSFLRQEVESVVSYASGRHSAGGLAITRERLAQLLEGQSVEGPIRAFLRGRFDPLFARFNLTAQTRTVLAQLLSHPYRGTMETIYLEAKAYELLAENLRFLSDEIVHDGISSSRKHALEAREFMMADLACPPSIGEVARQVGLSQRALANVFHEVYGASPLNCLNTWRLEAARGLLLSGEYSVKQVAYLLGYTHPNNFSQAFFRQFGSWPSHFQASVGSLRNSAVRT